MMFDDNFKNLTEREIRWIIDIFDDITNGDTHKASYKIGCLYEGWSRKDV